MENMITVLYLEKSKKDKQLKARETTVSHHTNSSISSPRLILVLYGWQILPFKHLVCFQQSYFFKFRIPHLLCQGHISRRSAPQVLAHIRQPECSVDQGLGFLSQDSTLGLGGAEFSLGMDLGPDVMKGALFIVPLQN